MKKFSLVFLSAILFVSAFFGGSVSGASAKGPKVLSFDSMVGVTDGLTGDKSLPVMRNIRGGGIPWIIGDASGQLRANGHLEISVQGLVLATTGSNPSPFFRGMVSCVNGDGTIAAPVVTQQFPATTGPASLGGGNAEIEADLTLPQPCIAPIVFVTNGTGTAWFAATGN